MSLFGFDYIGAGPPQFAGPQGLVADYFDRVGRVVYVWDGASGRWVSGSNTNSTLDGVTALGTTQATATVITGVPTAINITTAAGGTGILLPPSWQGAEIAVANNTASTTSLIYPFGTETINSLAAGAGFVMTVANAITILYCFTQGKWYTK